VALKQNGTYFMTLVDMATAMALHFYHYHRLHGTNQKEKNQAQMTMILN
jgi:hypothetical protein